MKIIKKALRELRTVLVSTALFRCMMDSLVVFLIIFLVLALIALPWHWALIPWALYLVIHTRTGLKSVSLSRVEEKVPALREALRTSADYAGEEGEIVSLLHQEVLAKMKAIKTSYFIGFGKTTRQLLVITSLCFLIIVLAALNVRFFDATKLSLELMSLKPVQHYGGVMPQEAVLGQNESLIYGNESIAALGKEELQLEINPLLSDIDIEKTSPPEKREFMEVFPEDIAAVGDQAFEDRIPKEHRKIVKNYFRQITTK